MYPSSRPKHIASIFRSEDGDSMSEALASTDESTRRLRLKGGRYQNNMLFCITITYSDLCLRVDVSK